MSNKQNDVYNEYIIPYNEFEDYLKEKKFKNVKSIASQLVHRVKIHDELFHRVKIHDELVEVLGLTKSYIENNEDKLDETQELVELVESINEALLKAKANQ